jgi:pyruvate/2-oxoglutarate dehydrogenase complex dihydrolipoamide acyltransferase (E2) component
MAIRPKLRKSLGVKITTNAFYIRALGLAVQKYPLAAGKFDGDNIRIAERVNVGFAVNAPQGLVVPVVKDAGEKTLPEIAREEASLTNKARDNQLTLEHIEGETIALSNLGAYGTDSFLGIVPPPTSTILAVGNVVHTVVCENDIITVRKIVSLSLAVDQRVINETYAAEFLSFITEELQNPQRLI